MMDTIGVLTKRGLSYLPEVYKDVLHRKDPHYRPRLPDIPFKHKPSADNPRYREELYRVSAHSTAFKTELTYKTAGINSIGVEGK